jgi:hypothetical protein
MFRLTCLCLLAAAQSTIQITRHITSVEAGASGTVNIDKDCTTKDEYGCESALAKWGDSLKVSLNATLPHDLTADYSVIVKAKVNNIIPFDVTCAICGVDCTVTIPIIKKKLTIKLPPCPIKAATYLNSTTVVLPAKAPVPLKVSATGTGSVQDSKGNVVADVSVSLEVTPA